VDRFAAVAVCVCVFMCHMITLDQELISYCYPSCCCCWCCCCCSSSSSCWGYTLQKKPKAPSFQLG